MPNDPPEDIPSQFGDTPQWVRGIHVRARLLNSIDSTLLTNLLEKLPSVHHLDGVAVDESPPILMLRCRDGVSTRPLAGGHFRVMAWEWPSRFGACLTITVFGQTGLASRISLDQDTQAFRQLENGQCMVVFAKGAQVIAAFDVDLAATPLAKEQFTMHWQSVRHHQAIVRDVGATYWQGVEHNKNLARFLIANDRLSCGWSRAFHAVARHGNEALLELSDSALLRDYKQTAEVPETVTQFLDVVSTANTSLTRIYEYFATQLGETGWLVRFLKDVKRLHDFDQWSRAYYAPGILFASFLHNSSLTRCGRALPWIDGAHGGQVRQLVLEPERFAGEDAGLYWARLPYSFFIDWGILISGQDVCMSPPDLQQGWLKVKLGADIHEIEASVDALLEEAAATKKWTVPPHAVVEYKFGPFAYCEVVELEHEVYFVLRDAQWRFCIACVNPETRAWYIEVWTEEAGVRRDEVTAAAKLLLAAILRDFWVVEERESVFTPVALPQRLAKGTRTEEHARIVYVPRVQYKGVPNLSRCSESLGQDQRRQHFVTAHLRRAEDASKGARLLAELYGFTVPTGYTFVRPHERGHKKMEVIYRSRSALRSLYTAVESNISAPRPRWFQFEQDVYHLMERLGYDVQHVSASGQGDHGVDVYATRTTAQQIETWVIQCKCYSDTRKVGPNIVRELIGSLSRYGTATKGMLVTTSSYSAGAIEEAARVGIRLINGAEFVTLIKA